MAPWAFSLCWDVSKTQMDIPKGQLRSTSVKSMRHQRRFNRRFNGLINFLVRLFLCNITVTTKVFKIKKSNNCFLNGLF